MSGTLRIQYPIYPDLTRPKGYLSKDLGCQACWYYYTIAQMAKERVGKGPESQILLEGMDWKSKKYLQQKKSVGLMYGIDPSHMDKFWSLVTLQAEALDLPEPSQEYMYVNPLRLGVSE